MFRAASKALLEVVGLAGPYRDGKVDQIRVTVGEFKRHRERLDVNAMKRASLLANARELRRLSQFDRSARARALLFAAGRVVLPVDDDVSRVVMRLMGLVNKTPPRRGQTIVGDGAAEKLECLS
ncbi:MAG: hypothetical protein H0T71_15475 [Acidobacteria bacterium]|nr:hypothetical protein [Acidobacteriota bacterium]